VPSTPAPPAPEIVPSGSDPMPSTLSTIPAPAMVPLHLYKAVEKEAAGNFLQAEYLSGCEFSVFTTIYISY
ncbi:hypothetical protein JB92DRAFT_2940107, partial [Gautieria morchelliformis]